METGTQVKVEKTLQTQFHREGDCRPSSSLLPEKALVDVIKKKKKT